MLKRILCLAVMLALFAGLSLSPAHAGLLEDLLAAGNLPAERTVRAGGEFITVRARLDRNNQLVYGLPTQVPGNDWKSTETCWQTDNGASVGRPNQEPRYLGYDWQGNLFSNAWFPDDAPHRIPPADLRLIENPWNEGYTRTKNKGVSADTWRIVAAALAEFHRTQTPGFPNNKAFPLNPAFGGKFDKSVLERYFLVLSEPRPGIAGTVRYWHFRPDLGGVFYTTLVVEWQIIPDFRVMTELDGEAISYLDPGTELAKPGETYRGKLIIGGLALDDSYLEDPLNQRLYQTMYRDQEPLPQRYPIPLGVAVDGKLISVPGLPTIATNVHMVEVGQGTTAIEFDWRLPDGYGKQEIALEAQVNWADNLLSGPGVADPVYRHMVHGEWWKLNNYTKVTIPTSIVWPDFSVELIPDRFEAQAGQALTGTVRYKLNDDHPQAETAWLRLHHLTQSEHALALRPVNPADAPNAQGHVVFQPGDVKEYRYSFTVQAASQKIIARINPISVSHDKDWSNNRAEAPIVQPCTDVRIAMSRSPDGVRYAGDTTRVTAVVTRANDGPVGSVPVRVRITGPGLSYDQTINLARGESRTINQAVTLNNPGSHAYQGSAWPQGIEDCAPANNTGSVTIPVQAPVRYDVPDSRQTTELVSGR